MASHNIAPEMVEIIERHEIPPNWVFGSFPIYARRINVAQFLTMYELFKRIVGLPGHIVECGVFQGKNLFTFQMLLETFCPHDDLKKVIGFDNFAGFTGFADEDGPVTGERDKRIGGWSPEAFLPAFEEIRELRAKEQVDPGVNRVEVVIGDISETVPAYVAENDGLRICMLNLDVDLYEPTMVALEQLYPKVVPGGIVMLDEFGIEAWQGESRAFDEYFGDDKPPLEKFPWAPTPGAFFVKPHR